MEKFPPYEEKESEWKLIIDNKNVIDYSKAEKKPQIIAAIAAALGIYILGTTFGWSSSVSPQLLRTLGNMSMEPFDDADLYTNTTASIWYLKLSGDEMSWAASLVVVGALMGSMAGGFLMDKFGRRNTLMAMSVPYFIGWLFITFAIHPGMLYGGRLICGLAAGICSAIVPCYIGEISTPTMRGVVGMFFSIGLGFGVFVASLLVWLDWRWISGFLGIQPLFLVAAMFFVPESPFFLVKRGRIQAAEKSLTWLRGLEFDVSAELDQIKERARFDGTKKVRLSDLRDPSAYKPILIGVWMMIFMQFSGLNAALFNAVPIFLLSGSSIGSDFCAVIITAVQVIMGALSSLFLVGRFGRKTLHATTEIISSICLFVLGGYFYILGQDPETAANLGWLPLTCLIGFIASTAAGIAPLGWIVSNEVIPARLRGPGSSIAAFTSWTCAFIVTKTYLDIQRVLTTAGVFWIYASFCFIGFLFSAFILPETKGKTPEEIQSFFTSSSKRIKEDKSTQT